MILLTATVLVKPFTTQIQGALILFDGYSGNADAMLRETNHSVACTNDILTICIPTGPRLYADKSMIELLNRVLTDIIK